jgi:hypothetical protein
MSEIIDSYEVIRLKKMIASKEAYLAKIPPEKTVSHQITQQEIMFLKNDILPILYRNTNIKHFEFAKYALQKFETAIDLKCNGLLMYYPIDENYIDEPRIGIANMRANQKFGTFGAIEIYVDNMDGNGVKIKPINLNL